MLAVKLSRANVENSLSVSYNYSYGTRKKIAPPRAFNGWIPYDEHFINAKTARWRPENTAKCWRGQWQEFS